LRLRRLVRNADATVGTLHRATVSHSSDHALISVDNQNHLRDAEATIFRGEA